MSKRKMIVGSVVKLHSAYNNYFYRVMELPTEGINKRAKVLTEEGIRFYLVEDLKVVNTKKLTKKDLIAFISNGYLIQKIK